MALYSLHMLSESKKTFKIKTLITGLVVAAMLPLLFACSQTTTVDSSALVVNEVVSSNKRSLVDETLGTPDWIELYNSGSVSLDLSGYGVSDNLRNLHKFVVPEGTILGAGEYLVLYATNSSDDQTNPMITNFGLSKSGDLFLSPTRFSALSRRWKSRAVYGCFVCA
jgi:folate-dependent tRNA-U54 methylase TrmFO/GidA